MRKVGIIALIMLLGGHANATTATISLAKHGVRTATGMTTAQAKRHEQHLHVSPDDAYLRAALLVHWFTAYRAANTNQQMQLRIYAGERYLAHMVWFIRNLPHADVLHNAYDIVNLEKRFIIEVDWAWRRTLAERPAEPCVLAAASLAYLSFDAETSFQFVEEAVMLTPPNVAQPPSLRGPVLAVASECG